MNAWYQNLSARERQFVFYGAPVAALIALMLVLVPLHRKASQAENRVATKTTDLAWMRSVAPALANAGPAAEAPATQESIVVIVDRAAREAGLATALTSNEPAGDGGQRLRLENASFDMTVAWLARLREQHAVRVVSATVESTGDPGIVNATVVLRAR